MTSFWAARPFSTSATAALKAGSFGLAVLDWMSTCSPAVWGKLSLTISAERAASPTRPSSSEGMVLVPIWPPMNTAAMTNASQPNTAFLRCCALQRPARAARFCFCTGEAPWGGSGTVRIAHGRAAPQPWGLPVEHRWVEPAQRWCGYLLARRSSSRPNAVSVACVMRGWKIATSTSVASGRSCSSAASTAGQSVSGWPARSNGFQTRSRKSLTKASATLSAWRATSRSRRATSPAGSRAPAASRRRAAASGSGSRSAPPPAARRSRASPRA